jgi:mRNA interferase MazF
MAKVLRGEIVWADLNPTQGNEQTGKRPVLILSHNIFNDKSGTVICVALTSQQQKTSFPLTLELKDKQYSKRSWVKISQIRTLSVLRLGKKIGHATAEELDLVIEGLNEIIN